MIALSSETVRSTFRELGWAQADLRFESADIEATFRKRLRERSFLFASLAGFAHVLLQTVVTLSFVLREDALSFSAYDIIYLSFQGTAAVCMTIVSTASTLIEVRGHNSLRSLFSSEAPWACAIGMSIIAAFLQGPQGQFWLGAELLTSCDGTIDLEVSAYLLSVFVSICCYSLPIRCCYLFLLVSLAMVSISVQAFGAFGTFGTPGHIPQRLAIGPRVANTLLTLAMLASSFRVAYSAEKADRKLLVSRSSQQHFTMATVRQKALCVAALERDLKVLRSCGCSLAFGLMHDLHVCCGSLRAAQTLLGDVAGDNFLSLILEADRERFVSLCHLAFGCLARQDMIPMNMVILILRSVFIIFWF